jgi:hypothetical protein
MIEMKAAGQDKGGTLRSGNTQERARPQDPSHETPCIGSQGPSALEGRARVLSSGREPVHAVGDRSGAPVRVQARWASPDRVAHPSSHLLLAPRMHGAAPKAIQELAGHSTRDDDAVHAPCPIALRQAIELLNFGQPVGNAAITGS